MKLEGYINKLPSLFCRVLKLEQLSNEVNTPIEETKLIKYTVDNYTELLTVADQEIDNIAFVRNSQGTWWLPGKLLGDFYGKGFYIWDGVEWQEANDEINAALQSLIDEQAAINAAINEEHKVEFITADYTLPDSSTFIGEVDVKNVSNKKLTVDTIALDKLEEEDSLEIFPGESFTIRVYQANDYRII